MRNLNDNLIYLFFYTNTIYEYIVRKSDGAIFAVPIEISQNMRPGDPISTDGQNNIYVLGGHVKDTYASSVYKISGRIDNGLTAQKLTNEYGVNFTFRSDNDGNLLFNTLDNKIVGRTADNGPFCLTDMKMDCNRIFTLNGKNGFYYFGDNNLSVLIPNEQTQQIETTILRTVPNAPAGSQILDILYENDKTILILSGAICIIRDIDDIKTIPCSMDHNQYRDIRIVNHYYYWQEKPGYTSNNKILRFDTDKDIVETVFYDENYTVNNFVCDTYGNITFTGMNLKIGRQIKGNITNGIFSETLLTDDSENIGNIVNLVQIG